MPALPSDHFDLLTFVLWAIGELPSRPEFVTRYAVLDNWLCGADAIGHGRAGLSAVEAGPPQGEMSSPRSANHPGEDRLRL